MTLSFRRKSRSQWQDISINIDNEKTRNEIIWDVFNSVLRGKCIAVVSVRVPIRNTWHIQNPILLAEFIYGDTVCKDEVQGSHQR